MPSALTATEARLLAVLADGLPHHHDELFACLPDELSRRNALHAQLSRLRKKLPPGHAILCEFTKRAVHYRHVILLPEAVRAGG